MSLDTAARFKTLGSRPPEQRENVARLFVGSRIRVDLRDTELVFEGMAVSVAVLFAGASASSVIVLRRDGYARDVALSLANVKRIRRITLEGEVK